MWMKLLTLNLSLHISLFLYPPGQVRIEADRLFCSRISWWENSSASSWLIIFLVPIISAKGVGNLQHSAAFNTWGHLVCFCMSSPEFSVMQLLCKFSESPVPANSQVKEDLSVQIPEASRRACEVCELCSYLGLIEAGPFRKWIVWKQGNK